MEKRYVTIMVLCFVFGGYFLFSSLYQTGAFSLGAGSGFFPEPPSDSDEILESMGNLTNRSQRFGPGFRQNPFTAAIPLQFTGGVVMIISGITMWYLTNEKEMKSVKDDVTNSLLLPEEKKVIAELRKQGGQFTQKKLARETGLTKVKIHRVLNKLEEKNLIERQPYGSTKMVTLKEKS